MHKKTTSKAPKIGSNCLQSQDFLNDGWVLIVSSTYAPKERKKEKKQLLYISLSLSRRNTSQLILSFSEQLLVVILQRILSSKTTKESKSSKIL
jgi:hypothetical protein